MPSFSDDKSSSDCYTILLDQVLRMLLHPVEQRQIYPAGSNEMQIMAQSNKLLCIIFNINGFYVSFISECWTRVNLC